MEKIDQNKLTDEQFSSFKLWTAAKIIADILFIVILVYGLANAYVNLEDYKTLGKDVCALCKERTGANCILEYTSVYQNKSYNVPTLNLSIIYSNISN